MATKEVPITGYGSKLLSRVEVAEGTMAFHFEKPSQFDFKPGQSADVTLFNPPETDSEGNTRTFSIASSPFENQLMFATRMRDTAFKRSLKKVPLGTNAKIDLPMGSFTLLKNSAKPAVFLSGGIGIRPFLSIVRQADHDRLHTSCISSIPTGGPKMRLFSTFFRCSKRATETSGWYAR
jgi:ferredoxin-NADP reductase